MNHGAYRHVPRLVCLVPPYHRPRDGGDPKLTQSYQKSDGSKDDGSLGLTVMAMIETQSRPPSCSLRRTSHDSILAHTLLVVKTLKIVL
jgi:hypothetical protein